MNIPSPTLRSLWLASLLVFPLLACQEGAPEAADREDAAAASSADAGDARAALAAAVASRDPYVRAERLASLLPTLGPEAIPAVRDVLNSFRLDLGGVEFELLLRYWATHDPEAATWWNYDHAGFLYKPTGARVTIEVWAEQDPQAALVAAERALAEAGETVSMVAETALIRGWFKNDRESLERYLESIGSGVKRQRALYAFALSLAAADGSETAMEWAEAVPDDDFRYKLDAFRQVTVALAWADIGAAREFCDEHCDGPYGKGLREIITRTRLRNGDDGAEIVEWVGKIPETDEVVIENKKHSLWVAYSTWAHKQPEEALAWMDAKLSGETPEAWLGYLRGEYARQLAADDPEKALGVAIGVEDENDRERTLVRIARLWMRRDPEAAEAWIASSPLNERARTSARNTAQPTYLPRVSEEG